MSAMQPAAAAGPAAGGAERPPCGRCGRPAAYTRRYSGQSLCAPCFVASIEKKVAKTISKYGMIRDGDSVAVAVSGGKDSLALLRIMHGMAQRHSFEILPITIDEGIPGYRDEALGLVSDACASLGVGHRVYAYRDLFGTTLEQALGARDAADGRRISSPSSCSICGVLRRRAIDLAAEDVGADSVATGHNLDDVLQTFLINVLSGDTDRIAWMNPGGGGNKPRRIKPFCEIYESEIVFYAFAGGLPFQQEPCPHMDEGIRTEIREFLNSLESRHSGIKNSMYASVLRMVGMARGGGTEAAAAAAAAGASPPALAAATTASAPAAGAPLAGVTAAATTAAAAARKTRMRCARCGADCTGGGGGGLCSACGVVLGLSGRG